MLEWLLVFWRETGLIERSCFVLIGAMITAAFLPVEIFVKFVGGAVALCALIAMLMALAGAISKRADRLLEQQHDNSGKSIH